MSTEFPHGLMFHHFCNDRHPRGQGAINAEEFEAILHHVGLERILTAEEWIQRSKAGTLNQQHCCLTFDDNLRCQFDVAWPVMERLGLTGFWFIYTAPIEGSADQLELYRYFRTVNFPTIEAFYEAFFAAVCKSAAADKFIAATANFVPAEYLKEFPFYTEQDRLFRFTRDKVLGPIAYSEVMDDMIEAAKLNIADIRKLLWMGPHELRQLAAKGNVIGLHSHSHPTELASLPIEAQHSEYAKNKDLLYSITGVWPVTAGHPCNSYSADTLAILRNMGVFLAFRSNMAAGRARNSLEMPREDHTNILYRMRKAG